MSLILDAISRTAQLAPNSIAFECGYPSEPVTYAQLLQSVSRLADVIRRHDLGSVALVADNGEGWATSDLACIEAGRTVIPVPLFFSSSQIIHLFQTAGINGVLTDQPDMVRSMCDKMNLGFVEPEVIQLAISTVYLFMLTVPARAVPEGCAKVTFTSGSTGDPKGVCLSLTAMEAVAVSLSEVTAASATDRHLTLLPYATLLENIGGLYAPLLAGATICMPGLAAVGLSGATGLDVQRFVGMLHASSATSCIMIPQMMHALVAAIEGGAAKPEMLRYIAVGGAPVSESLLQRAAGLGLPVFEGYGLSEAASVVAVNSSASNRIGSVGRLLPHVQLKVADDGEILVAGSLFSAYLGEPQCEEEYWPTGDIGSLDDDGYLYLTGRKKHIFITAFGRNVSPEWVERELSIEPAIAQCCLFGEARPFNVAVIVPRPDLADDVIAAAVATANSRLPDYARISNWLIADQPFSIGNGMWTGTGRPRRKQIYQTYEQALNALYQESE